MVKHNFGIESLGMLEETLHQLRSLHAIHVGRPVVHIRGRHQLATLGDAGDQHRVEVGAGGINGCGVACGAGTKNQDFGVLGGGHGVRVV